MPFNQILSAEEVRNLDNQLRILVEEISNSIETNWPSDDSLDYENELPRTPEELLVTHKDYVEVSSTTNENIQAQTVVISQKLQLDQSSNGSQSTPIEVEPTTQQGTAPKKRRRQNKETNGVKKAMIKKAQQMTDRNGHYEMYTITRSGRKSKRAACLACQMTCKRR